MNVQHVYPVDDPTHDTDGGFCWCQPETEDVPPDGRLVIHRRSLDSPHREDAARAAAPAGENRWTAQELLDIFDRTTDRPAIRAKITDIVRPRRG